MATGGPDKIKSSILTAYSLTIAAFYAASFFPEARLWGVNWPGFFGWYGPIALLVVALVIQQIVTWAQKTDSPASGRRAYAPWAAITVVLFTLAFVVFRGRTHFLGDGYQILDWQSRTGDIP